MLADLCGAGPGSDPELARLLVIVTASTSPGEAAQAVALAPAGARLHMSSATWFNYGIGQAGTFAMAQGAGAGAESTVARAPWDGPVKVIGVGLPASTAELVQLARGWLAQA